MPQRVERVGPELSMFVPITPAFENIGPSIILRSILYSNSTHAAFGMNMYMRHDAAHSTPVYIFAWIIHCENITKIILFLLNIFAGICK